MTWFYNEKEITDEQLVGYKAFVYLITNLVSDRMYVGKKRLKFIRRKHVRNRKNRVKTIRESDWRNYWGSSEELKADVLRLGQENFKREILMLCNSFSEANYYEIKTQIDREVLFHPERYYNAYIGCRISRNQMRIKTGT
jgi:hypothetical protein